MPELAATNSPYARELGVAYDLALAAGIVVMAVRNGVGADGSADLGVEWKPGDEPVTIADKRASALIVAGLRQAFPDDVVISEEAPDDLARLTASRVWYVDPVDGTKDFFRGGEGFAVMIGLTVAHAPTVGVVHQPAGDRTFMAIRDAGAWLVDKAGTRTITCSSIADAAAIRLVASASHRTGDIDRVKGALGIANELNIGSVGVKLCLIAAGERDLYVNPSSKCKAWDTCAPEVILVAAGGKLTDLHGDAVRYDETSLGRTRGLIASNSLVHDDVIARMAPLFPRR